MPKAAECENLLVPICLSATHIAYGSIRMEPVFMILGQSAATAAALALDANRPCKTLIMTASAPDCWRTSRCSSGNGDDRAAMVLPSRQGVPTARQRLGLRQSSGALAAGESLV